VNEMFRPSIKGFVEIKSDKYLKRTEKYYEGTILTGKYKYAGWVEWYKDENNNPKKMMVLFFFGFVFVLYQ
jgi:hypothetical protein